MMIFKSKSVVNINKIEVILQVGLSVYFFIGTTYLLLYICLFNSF